MDNVTEIKTTPIRNFIARHKVAITVVATSTVWFAIQSRAAKQVNEFLKEHDLYDEFYTPEDE